jgi:predicted lipoprotein
MKYLLSALALLFILCFDSCKPRAGDPCAFEFDQTTMLSNIGNNIITPAYDLLKQEVDALDAATTTFLSNRSLGALDTLQTAWWSAQEAWQKAMIYEFGPADVQQLRSSLNNFPVFVTRLEAAVQSGTYNLAIDSFAYTRGFPALDYLLYGVGVNNNDILVKYDTDANAANRRQYLQDVVTQIKTKVDLVHSEWAGYKTSFASTTGVATGSPVALLVNEFNHNYEFFKNNKLGTPVGAKNSYIPAADKTEAYYSRRSLDLMRISVRAMQELFEGKGGIGLYEYVAAANVDKDGILLQDLIKDQFTTIINGLDALPGASLYDAIQNNFNDLKTIYGNAQNMVVYLKTDMPSVLCVSITYVDNTDDGD